MKTNGAPEKYIPKSDLVAEIEKWLEETDKGFPNDHNLGRYDMCKQILSFLDTLEVKEVDLEKFECPTIKVKDDVSVSSRMQYIDDELKPIAEFIMEYASWNLHKEEWNHPVLEVPLFRVLDALIQRGKPYCEG